MFNWSKITKENIQQCFSTKYILIDNFIDQTQLESLHNIFLESDKDLCSDNNELLTIDGHPILDEIRKQEKRFVNLINDVWNEKCKRMKTIVNLMTSNHVLPIHEDSFWTNVPVRGILYLNGIYGTHFHRTVNGREIVELGGKPGQLLLFKIHNDSLHSAGLIKKSNDDRYVISIQFES